MPGRIQNMGQPAQVATLVASRASRLRMLQSARPRPSDRGKTHRLAVVLPDRHNVVYSEIAETIESIAGPRGYDCIFLYSDGQADREARFLHFGLDHTVDGLIVFSPFFEENHVLYLQLSESRCPLVLRGVPSEHWPELDFVTVDMEYGGYLATRYLRELGHVAIGILVSDFALGRDGGHWRGYRRALEEAHSAVRRELCVHGGRLLGDGYRAIRDLLQRHPEVSALFCHNDHLAMASFRAARELGRRIPDDLSVIGFDDVDMGEFYEVPLTTVNHPKKLEGELLADIVVNRIEQPGQPPCQVVLKPKLVVRASCSRRCG